MSFLFCFCIYRLAQVQDELKPKIPEFYFDGGFTDEVSNSGWQILVSSTLICKGSSTVLSPFKTE